MKMGLSPIETFEAIKSLVMSGDLVRNVADSMKQSFIERIDRLTTEYERAGPSGAFKAGVEAGKLIVEVVPWVTGGPNSILQVVAGVMGVVIFSAALFEWFAKIAA